MSVVGRALTLVTTLTDTATLLKGAIEKRNHLIEQYKLGRVEMNPTFPLLYFPGSPIKVTLILTTRAP